MILFPIGPSQRELGTHRTDWGTRGWTCQENFFSLKRLVFDGDSVRWECTAATWRKHVEPDLDDESHDNSFPCQTIFTPPFADLIWLQSVLQEYNKRNFTYPEDALYAFDGIAFLASSCPTSIFSKARFQIQRNSASNCALSAPARADSGLNIRNIAIGVRSDPFPLHVPDRTVGIAYTCSNAVIETGSADVFLLS